MREEAPLNYFLHAHGPAARPTLWLDWWFTAIVVTVCIVIALLLAMAIWHKRPTGNAARISDERKGLHWVALGTGISICMLLGMTVYMLMTLNAVSAPPSTPALAITVTGYDWWWKADYSGFSTANEIHIPVGVPVLINLRSADVIHAFWVPQLAGKTQMIPGMRNRQWIEADKPGVYRGQCTQFCGAQHAHMMFEVVAETPSEFEAWEKAQRQPAANAAPRVFMENCAGCHAVRGTQAAGSHAPDLTHLMSRRLIAAGMFVNAPEPLAQWVAHAQEMKPGCRMPDFMLPAEDAKALSEYLASLK